MRETMVRVWNREAKFARWFLYIPLAFLSYLYQIGLMAREYMYRTGLMKTQTAPIPVISVGNITLGGTGENARCRTALPEIQRKGL